jgi:hypothetical protein
LAKYGTDPRKVTGTTILGRYLSKMKLKQNAGKHFKDTERYVRDDAKQRQAFLQQIRNSVSGLQPLDLEETNFEEEQEQDNEI